MFARIFIDRPILAWVISIVIVLFGLAALYRLPIAQYPEITPPTVTVSAFYPGANARVVSDTVAAPIELAVNGVENMLYMSSTCGNDGSYSLTVTFALGTDPNLAQVLVQNRAQLAITQLPQEVQRTGLSVRKRSPDILLVVNIFSPDGSRDQLFLSNLATIQVRDELARVNGVGDVSVFGQQDYSMRAWLDPDKLTANGLTVSDVLAAIQEQNIQVAAGQVGQEPALPGQAFQYTLSTLGRLSDPGQFADIVIKVAPSPTTPGDPNMPTTPESPTVRPVVRLRDVARVELTAKSQDIANTLDGRPAVGVACFQLPGSNALETADRIKEKVRQIKTRFPSGVEAAIYYDTTPFVRQSVDEVFSTLIEAVILVAIVVLLFLQDWRAMILPMIDVPVSLIGTLAVMSLLGFTLNNLTLFGLVLAIGIVVDDAIVVLENVERWIAQGYPAREATIHAMAEITGPIVAITLVLSSVFLPTAFVGGVSGQFYKQFALTISVSMMISAINAMTLTPSRAVAIFKGHESGEGHRQPESLPRIGWAALFGYLGYRLIESLVGALPFVPAEMPPLAPNAPAIGSFLGWLGGHALLFAPGAILGWFVGPFLNRILRGFYRRFNAVFDRITRGYQGLIRRMLRITVVVLVVYLGLVITTGVAFTKTPTGYIPLQDKGYLLVSVQLPDAASGQRTRAVLAEADRIARSMPGVSHTIGIAGQSFVLGATGSNFGTMFIILDDFEVRKKDRNQNGFLIMLALQARLRAEVADAQFAVFPPPPVSGLGTAGGFRVMVEDRGDLGPNGLETETNRLLAQMREQPALGPAFTVYRANVPQLYVDIDRVRCKQMGVPLGDVFATLQVYLGGQYVNDFNRFGRTWQVNVQADAPFRMTADTIRTLRVRNDQGAMVPLGSVAKIEEISGPVVIQRYNTFPAAAVNGNVAPGFSTGQGVAAVEKAGAALSDQAALEWTELLFLQQQEGSAMIMAFVGAVILVYVVLAGLYESWTLPLAVLFVVPMCLLSAIGGVWLFALSFGFAPEINIFTQVGFVVLVGLATKNAILIVEFAEDRRRAGSSLRDATLEAVHLRLRPIIMTSFAFILGVVPLILAQGAGAEMRRTLGIAVFSGMLGVTFFGLLFTPIFYYALGWLLHRHDHIAKSTDPAQLGAD